MEKLLLKGNPQESSEKECRNQDVIITITLNCNALPFPYLHSNTKHSHLQNWFRLLKYQMCCQSSTQVSGSYSCLYEMKLLILLYSSTCTPGRRRQHKPRDGVFPKLQCEKDYKQLTPYTWMGFLARGNPSGIRNGDVKRFSWGEGGWCPGCL